MRLASCEPRLMKVVENGVQATKPRPATCTCASTFCWVFYVQRVVFETFEGVLRLMRDSETLRPPKRMRQVAKVGILLLALLITGAPLLACMLPGTSLSAEEQACCRQMGNQCGQESMPASHSCCKNVGPTAHHAIAKSSFKLVRESQTLYQVHPTVQVAELPHLAIANFAAVGHAPPEPPPPSIDLLRI